MEARLLALFPGVDVDGLLARFRAKVQMTDGCWWWTAAISDNGYGKFCVKKPRLIDAHRLSYLISVGELLDGQVVCHRCDNRNCVRPDHLFAGTQLDNMRDMIAKGRAAVGAALHHPNQAGEANHAAKLSEADVRNILARRAAGEKPTIIAKDYGIAYRTLWAIVTGRRWAHLQ